jgi:hypothetical protein
MNEREYSDWLTSQIHNAGGDFDSSGNVVKGHTLWEELFNVKRYK